MNQPRYYLTSAILACLLASCNIGDPTVYPNTEVPNVPEKSTRGKDIVVCMVNNNINFEVYREVHEMMFDEQEVRVGRYQLYSRNGGLPGYQISANRRPETGPGTSLHLSVQVDKPEINTDYKLYDAEYFLEYYYNSGQYRLDTNVSMIRFSRIDTIVAAGEFIFKAVDQVHDTVVIRGYFDIPFED